MIIEMAIVFSAFIIDLAVGDPRALPHPVVGMGRVISKLERPLRAAAASPLLLQLFRASNEGRALKLAGIAYPFVLVGGSFCAGWAILYVLGLLHPWLAYAAAAWMISTTIAAKGLGDAGMDIYRLLKQDKLPEARYALSMIVGRDTEQLDESEITRGAVETVAENIVDAILSPLFYAFIGGAPLALAYRAANTLDSMVGYKNEKYRNLGWASARFDDMANWIPARLSAVAIAAAAALLRLRAGTVPSVVRRYARLHPSPNSGFPESAVAGALGIQLGGLNYYKGVASDRARMGEPLHPLQAEHIRLAVRIMYIASFIFVLAALAISFAVARLFAHT